MRQPVIAVAAATLLGTAIVVGCQTYDFEPVQPLAVAQTTQSYSTIGRSLKPNMAMLVDKSGSMNLPVDPNNPACDVGAGLPSKCAQTGQPPCPAGCPTRLSDLKAAMSSFLTNSGKVARLCLSFFPTSGTGDVCAPASAISVPFPTTDLDADLQTTANNINSAVSAAVPGGGTPTAQSLTFVGGQAALADSQRDNFILLLTDGLPNCNVNNPNNYNVNPTACKCTDTNTFSCAAAPQKLCLDEDATVSAITTLYATQNIRTIVVGFGAETSSGDGPTVLEAMARAGGFPRTCTGGTNAECGTGTCDVTSKTCSPAFYQAANAADLATVLGNIAKKISQTPCDYFLAVAPSNPAFISVLVNGNVVNAGPDTWQYLPAGGDAGQFGEVQLIGALCTQARSATPDNPINVEIRLLRTF